MTFIAVLSKDCALTEWLIESRRYQLSSVVKAGSLEVYWYKVNSYKNGKLTSWNTITVLCNTV